ncbi:Transcription elongation factor A N-terminal and central domain-containing protein 2 [Desmophyllum pertusum]|uniref:Transcription elongation factor A N-terminal and central domain-containing protein 2 n=1 Tax=Desmophyllum pertusum TaxID=174260 RepID=A0A9W9ZAQ3_9CNID|nr:Transcription elongation factor A N-terminal and central domain-containing protein 2 [Desmophyllum pertusum]
MLGSKNVSKDVLLSTKIGHTVNRLRRQGSSDEIREQAKLVFRRWRRFIRDLEREKPLIEVHCDKKTEVLRGKARQLLAENLQVTTTENLPELIERTVFHTFGRLINNTYKRKMRSLVFALKHRDTIREKVISGEITVKKFVTSSVDQLIS